jgi:hypothetical protein
MPGQPEGTAEFVRLKATTFVAQGAASVRLPGGQITVQGLAEFPTSNALPKRKRLRSPAAPTPTGTPAASCGSCRSTRPTPG